MTATDLQHDDAVLEDRTDHTGEPVVELRNLSKSYGDQVILEPIAKDWAWLDALVGPIDEDFARAVNEQPDQQQRPELDELFP